MMAKTHESHVCIDSIPNSKVHGTNMGPMWGRQDPGGPHVGPMNFAIWDYADGLVQERLNSSVLAMELHLFCTNPSMCIMSMV